MWMLGESRVIYGGTVSGEQWEHRENTAGQHREIPASSASASWLRLSSCTLPRETEKALLCYFVMPFEEVLPQLSHCTLKTPHYHMAIPPAGLPLL